MYEVPSMNWSFSSSFQKIFQAAFLLTVVLMVIVSILSVPMKKHTGLILGLRPANERQHYFVTTSLIGSMQA